MAMTFVEKILAYRSAQGEVRAGDIVTVEPDALLSHDNTAAIARIFREDLGRDRVAHPERLIIVLDHAAPPPTPRHAQNHREIRSFVQEQGVRHFFDVGTGISHQVIAEQGLVRPGQVLLGADSHTLHQGWLGAFAAGVGRTEMAALWATGRTWLRVPESIRVAVVGALPRGATARDAALALVTALGADGARYAAVEFAGPGLASLSPGDRMTLVNLMAEAGAKSAYVPPDEVTWAYLGGGTHEEKALAHELRPDAGASYRAVYRLHLDRVRPFVALPHRVDNGRPLDAVQGRPITMAFIGTCAGGRLEDLARAAAVLQGRRVHPNVRLIVVPASRRVLEEALKRGYIQTLVEAGALIGTPGCGPCMGNHFGVPEPGDVVVSTSNRNFRGRMGQPDAEIYLASAEVVAASAAAGYITSPKDGPEACQEPVVEVVQPPPPPEPVREPTPWPGREPVRGRAWVYGDHISTDEIFPGKYTYTLCTREEIAAHAMEDVDPRFAREVRPGDVLFVGENFGHGSSREQAVTCLKYAGVAAVVAKSYARIFYRNAVNQGLPVLESPQAVDAARPGDPVVIHWEAGVLELPAGRFPFRAPRGLAREILDAGGLAVWLKKAGAP